MRQAFYILILLFIFTSSLWASDNAPKFIVGVRVTADKNIEGVIKSYISRELRALADVKLYDIDPVYEIQIVAVQTNAGVSLSVNFVTYLHAKQLKFLVSNYMRDEFKSWAAALSEGLCEINSQYVQICSHRRLRDVCFEIVAEFNAKVLEGKRQTDQQMDDFIKDLWK